MIKELEFVSGWQKTVSVHFSAISQLLYSCHPICIEYDKSKQSVQDNSFNVFTIVSDLYYRENFHSDIIRFFLAPTENHGEGSLFLTTFISMLNKLGRKINVGFNNISSSIDINFDGGLNDAIISTNFS